MKRIILACAALFAAAHNCRSADLYRVAGVVIDSESGSPLARARVILLRSGTTITVATQVVGTDGRFSFEVPQGKFSLLAGTRDLQQTFGARTPDSRVGTSIVTGPDQNTSNLIFRWFLPGAISGRVADENREPVEGALVQLLASTVTAGRRWIATAGWVRTDDRGEYRFGPLRGGSYYVAVTGTPWYARHGVNLLSVPAIASLLQNSDPPLAYAADYYPGTPDIAGAAPMILRPGQEARADFSLSVVRGATVTVQHDGPPELKGLIGLLTEGIGGKDGFQRQENLTGSQPFTFSAVPPGRYVVRIAGSKGTSDYSGRRTIDVNGSDVTVELKVRAAPAVSGTVAWKNGKAKPPGLLASLIREDTGATISTTVRADGSFVFPSVTVARWRPAIRSADGQFATDVHVEGAEFDKGVIDLQDGDVVTVRMTASDEVGRLRGFVMRGDAAVEGVMVVLALAAGPGEQVTYRGFQTDSDGSFDFENVLARDYLLFAVEDTQFEYANPAVAGRYLAKAKRVHVEAHKALSEKIGLSDLVEDAKP
ncbi:MAG TPA: carboxypeptidase-like regulatory domain-containing protein [Bryobacteraceae bacterium]|nr:carboxypeptidase-like regulatory domain-containing protein [Bryobacteraceae bacterium]